MKIRIVSACGYPEKTLLEHYPCLERFGFELIPNDKYNWCLDAFVDINGWKKLTELYEAINNGHIDCGEHTFRHPGLMIEKESLVIVDQSIDYWYGDNDLSSRYRYGVNREDD